MGGIALHFQSLAQWKIGWSWTFLIMLLSLLAFFSGLVVFKLPSTACTWCLGFFVDQLHIALPRIVWDLRRRVGGGEYFACCEGQAWHEFDVFGVGP